jgi:hypothetical protein
VRPLALLLAAAAGLVFSGAAEAGQSCPRQAFLKYGHVVYASAQPPAAVALVAGAALGNGTLDEPTDASGCKRKEGSAGIVRLSGVHPSVAVGVSGRAGLAFVLGGRCSGYGPAERWDCLRRPLRFRGRDYVGVRYPGAGKKLPVAGPLGDVQLGGETVRAVGIEGVDPGVAVGVEGRPHEAFLAPGVCPYERFALRPAFDDLRRCLAGPVWLVFDPPGGRVGADIAARADRALLPALAGASVVLEQLRISADVIPRNPTSRALIGELGSETLEFAAPEVAPGLYEAVVTCRACATAYGGRTEFPAGSVLIGPERGGSSGPRILLLALGVLVLALALGLFAAFVVRRNRRRRASERAPAAP